MNPTTDRRSDTAAYIDPVPSQPTSPARRMNRAGFHAPLHCTNPRLSLSCANVWVEDALGNSICLVSRLKSEDAARVAKLLCEAVNRDAAHQAQIAESHVLLRSVMAATEPALRIREVPNLTCEDASNPDHVCFGTVRRFRVIEEHPWAGDEQNCCAHALQFREQNGMRFEAVNYGY